MAESLAVTVRTSASLSSEGISLAEAIGVREKRKSCCKRSWLSAESVSNDGRPAMY
jgi:hypothetical protein